MPIRPYSEYSPELSSGLHDMLASSVCGSAQNASYWYQASGQHGDSRALPLQVTKESANCLDGSDSQSSFMQGCPGPCSGAALGDSLEILQLST